MGTVYACMCCVSPFVTLSYVIMQVCTAHAREIIVLVLLHMVIA